MTVHTLAPKTGAETALREQFAALSAGADAQAAFADFERRGLPNRRDEAWHYTDLRAAMTRAAPPAPTPGQERLDIAASALAAMPLIGAIRLVIVDGRYVAALSDATPEGVALAISEQTPAPETPDPLASLNLAFTATPLKLDVAAGASPPSLEILHLSGTGAIYSRLEVSLGAGAAATIVERFEGGTAETQRNALAIVDLGQGARCDWTTIVADASALHVETPIVRLAEGGVFNDFGLICGGALARRQLDVGHSGPGAKIGLFGLSLIDGRRHADTTLKVRHAAPHGESREYFRHIVADQGVGVYQGKVIVAPHAQKTDGGMKSQALLLSPTAVMNNKPELEIFADDVVCGHGATVGALDAEQIFYLQARGLPKAEAEAMLLEAFGVEAIERVADEKIGEALREMLKTWLAKRATS